MNRLVVVEGDPVDGKDTHNVTGMTTSNPPVAYAGTADFIYSGSVTRALSDLVEINGVPVALVTSQSTLPPAETVPPTGRHSGPKGTNLVPAAPPPQPVTLTITEAPLGMGVPSMGAGSTLLTINGVKVLLDADPVDTCSGIGAKADSRVSAKGQNLLTCSA
jgi:hypothetical protein